MINIKIFSKNRELVVFVMLLFLFVIMGSKDMSSISISSLLRLYDNSLILIILAVGATWVLITRNIDISVGSIMGLSAAVLGISLKNGSPLMVAVMLALLVSLCCGLLNGMLVALLKIPAFVVTVGTLGVYRGLMLVLTGGQWIESLPESLKQLSINHYGFSFWGILVFILMLSSLFFLNKTRLGNYFYAVGDNQEGAFLLGISVQRFQLTSFCINGLCAGLAGIIYASQISFVQNTTGANIELQAIAACVLGGVSLLGGTGRVSGAALAAIFIITINTVLVILKFPAYWNNLIAGMMLIAVLSFDGYFQKLSERNNRMQRYHRKLLRGKK